MMRRRYRYLVGFVGFLLLCAVGLMVISLQRDIAKAKAQVRHSPHAAGTGKPAGYHAL